MKTTPIYLDYNATTPLKASARKAMIEVLDAPLNPSSIHSFGREAKKIITSATNQILSNLGAENSTIIFTSSGTESNNMAVNTIKNIELTITSAIEHISIFKPLDAKNKIIIPVDEDGLLNLEILEKTLKQNSGKRILVSIIHSNNETGVIQKANEIAKIVFENGAFLHFDCSQTIGKIHFNFNDIGADMVSISSHKLGGPKGVAALIIKKGLEVLPFILGGSQQKYLRAGTENLPAIVGFAAAIEESILNLQSYQTYTKNLISHFETNLIQKYNETIIFSKSANRLPNTSCFAISGKTNETELIKLDLKGFCLSAGSACSSGRVATSHVLDAMQAKLEFKKAALRLSIGMETTIEDIKNLLNNL